MLKKILMIGLLLASAQPSVAATIDQDLILASNIGDTFQGSIAALNVDDSIDGAQSGVTLVDFYMTIVGESFDSSTNKGTNSAMVEDGEVIAINFATEPGAGFVTVRTMQFFNTGYW